ncbi:MAG: rod-binding protein [Spirochaetota bacterium]|mgnify:CR=1 FL=1
MIDTIRAQAMELSANHKVDAALRRHHDGFKLPAGSKASELTRLKGAAEQMESIFVKKMLDSMRASVHKEKFIDGGMAENIFEDMLYDEYATTMSKTKSIGIADMIVKQMERYL